MYIDESGDYNDYLDSNGLIIQNRSRFFTLGGIIVNSSAKSDFEFYHSYLIEKYFNGINLPKNFKLHYHELRYKHFPYDLISERCKELADEIFSQIKNLDCHLISVTIHKENHCNRYDSPVSVLGYGLYLILERFQHFLNEKNELGQVIYERFSSRMKKLVVRIHKWLKATSTFPQPVNIDNLMKELLNGDPSKEVMLQYADFFAFAPWKKNESNHVLTCRYDEIKSKYYNLDHHIYFKRGNIEI